MSLIIFFSFFSFFFFFMSSRVKCICYPISHDICSYSGYIVIDEKEFEFHISLPDLITSNGICSSLKGASFSCDEELYSLLSGSKRILSQRLEQSRNLDEFLIELSDIIRRVIVGGTSSSIQNLNLPSPTLCTILLAELDAIKWDCVSSVDLLSRTIAFKLQDEKKRELELTLCFPLTYPKRAPTCQIDLPNKLEMAKLWSQIGTHEQHKLGPLLDRVQREIKKYDLLWSILEDFDTNTWVVEPEAPTLSCCMRRIALENFAFLRIELNPMEPMKVPEFNFLGIDNVVVPFRQKLFANLSSWNNSQFPRQNLERLLEITFPTKNRQSKEMSIECGICYSYRFDNMVPDFVCQNVSCGKPFHQKCLSNWLLLTPETHTTFNTIFGNCPYCGSSIHVNAN
jgi:E3 ubiquitin-protein ligase FANCL